MKRILLLLAVVAMLVFAFAPAAQAQQETIFVNERIPYTSTGPNPCTGEVVFIEGTQHIVFRAAYDGSGGAHTLEHNLLHGQGVSDSGAKYVLQSHGPGVLYIYGSEQGAFNITVESHANLIRQGEIREGENVTEDDWSARVLTHATVTANGELANEFVTVDIECQ